MWPLLNSKAGFLAAVVVGVVSLSNNNTHLEQSLRNVLEDSERLLARSYRA